MKTPSDRTDNPQLPHEQAALPQPRPRRRCPPAVQVGASCPDLSHLPKHLGGRCIYHSAGCATPVDGVDPCAPGPASSGGRWDVVGAGGERGPLAQPRREPEHITNALSTHDSPTHTRCMQEGTKKYSGSYERGLRPSRRRAAHQTSRGSRPSRVRSLPGWQSPTGASRRAPRALADCAGQRAAPRCTPQAHCHAAPRAELPALEPLERLRTPAARGITNQESTRRRCPESRGSGSA